MVLLQKNVDNLAGHLEFGEGEELVGILCHVDVVPEGDGWTYDPYGGEIVAGVPSMLLRAISLGSVMFGAMTYIGNGPNFMVKAIAERRGIKMPSFFGYMIFSLGVLLPVYMHSLPVFYCCVHFFGL